MKKIFLSVFLSGLIAFAGLVMANTSFTLTAHSTGNSITSTDTVYQWGTYNQFDIVAEVDMKNNSDSAKTYSWTKLKSNMGSWEVAICDKNNCYLPSITTQQFTLSASEKGIMNAHFYPAGVAGEGVLILQLKNLNEANDTANVVYKVKAYPTGIGDSKLLTYELNVYPSPADEFVKVSFSSNKTQDVEIYNILGKKLATLKISNSVIYDLTDLPAGLYFVKVKDEKGIVRTKTFIKS